MSGACRQLLARHPCVSGCQLDWPAVEAHVLRWQPVTSVLRLFVFLLISSHVPLPCLVPPCSQIGFSLADLNNPGKAVVVDCSATPLCPTFANGYLADGRIVATDAGEKALTLSENGVEAQYKFVTGLVAAEKLYTITLWGINPVGTAGTASTASEPVATLGVLPDGRGGHARPAGWLASEWKWQAWSAAACVPRAM